jgi:hypothetical protein
MTTGYDAEAAMPGSDVDSRRVGVEHAGGTVVVDVRHAVIDVSPTPTEHELVALVAAVACSLDVENDSLPDLPPSSAWAAAGRREAVQGLGPGAAAGWGWDGGGSWRLP